MHPQTGAAFPVKKEIKKMVTSYCNLYNRIVLVRRSRSGVGTGVGVNISQLESELELESLEIRRLRSPGIYDPIGPHAKRYCLICHLIALLYCFIYHPIESYVINEVINMLSSLKHAAAPNKTF